MSILYNSLRVFLATELNDELQCDHKNCLDKNVRHPCEYQETEHSYDVKKKPRILTYLIDIRFDTSSHCLKSILNSNQK